MALAIWGARIRVYVYVDGFNFYYGALKGTAWKWVNLVELSKLLVPSHFTISKVKYFTARVSGAEDPQSPRRQQAYLSALKTLPEVETTVPAAAPARRFEEARHLTEDNAELWYARDLMRIFGYDTWRRFRDVLTRAYASCQQGGVDPAGHFVRSDGKAPWNPEDPIFADPGKKSGRGRKAEDVLLGLRPRMWGTRVPAISSRQRV